MELALFTLNPRICTILPYHNAHGHFLSGFGHSGKITSSATPTNLFTHSTVRSGYMPEAVEPSLQVSLFPELSNVHQRLFSCNIGNKLVVGTDYCVLRSYQPQARESQELTHESCTASNTALLQHCLSNS